jgi:hypothetical protein
MSPASRPQMVREILWTEGYWHCELQTSAIPGEGRLLVFYRERVAIAESVQIGSIDVQTRAESLRLRVVRGDFLPAN